MTAATAPGIRYLARTELSRPEQHLPIPADVMIFECASTPGERTAWWSPANRVVLLLAGLPSQQRLEGLAHEAAHIALGHHGQVTAAETAEIERQADELGRILMRRAETLAEIETRR